MTSPTPRLAARLVLIVILAFSALVVQPSATEAGAPYIYYSYSGSPWTLVRRDSDGANAVTVYTPPVDYVRAIAVDHAGKLFFYDSQSGSQTIYKSDYDGSNRTTFLSVGIRALAAGKGYVYYALSGSPYSLMRRNADGTNPVTIYTPPVDNVYQVAIDFDNDKLYFYDQQSGSETIFKSDLDGSNRTTFVTAKINALAVGAGYVYYALNGSPYSLIRRNVDGSNPVTVYTPPVDYVRAVAVDATNSKLYFYDSQSGSQTIFKSDLDGANRTTFLSASILALATHGETPNSIELASISATRGGGATGGLLLAGLGLVILGGFAFMRRRTSEHASSRP